MQSDVKRGESDEMICLIPAVFDEFYLRGREGEILYRYQKYKEKCGGNFGKIHGF